MMLLAVVVVIVLVGVAGRLLSAPERSTAIALAVLGLIWILVNHPVEGPILLRLSDDHGVTVADLVAVLAWLLAAAAWFGRLRLPAAIGRRQRRNR